MIALILVQLIRQKHKSGNPGKPFSPGVDKICKMSIISNVLDALPLVGHAKAAIHLVAGDKDGAGRAFYQSSRTSAVLAGGAIGSIAGPVGAAAVAIYMGVIADSVASDIKKEPQGLLKDFEDIKTDIRDGRNCVNSMVSAFVHMGFDALGGYGMSGGIAENVGLNVASSVQEEIAETSVEEMAKQAIVITTRKSSEIAGQDVVEKTVEVAVKKGIARSVSKKGVETVAKKLVVASSKKAVVRVAEKTTETATRAILVQTSQRATINTVVKAGENAAKNVLVEGAEAVACHIAARAAIEDVRPHVNRPNNYRYTNDGRVVADGRRVDENGVNVEGAERVACYIPARVAIEDVRPHENRPNNYPYTNAGRIVADGRRVDENGVNDEIIRVRSLGIAPNC